MATREPMNEKWITHYSSNHQILLVGEGDFSFSLSLANAFASASNICATSLDSYDDLKKYKNAASNLEKLSRLGATLLHRVNVATMKLHPVLANRKFDRIIFNFPHAGFKGKEDNPEMIGKHRDLVQHFFWNARRMLRVDGEIHVNHKTGPPYCLWNLKELADASFLALIQCVDFNIEDYPGYRNKRGDGPNCDAPFRLGKSCTLKFGVCPRAEKAAKATRRPMQLQPTSGFNYPQRNLVVNHIPSNHGWPPTIPSGNQFSEVLDRNLLLVRKYGRDSNGVETNRGRILRL